MVTLDQIKELREATGVAMQACKNALEEAGGDMDRAITVLRKRGEAKAADRAGRSAGEGRVAIAREGDKASMIELRCETDFVARGDDFVASAADFARKELDGTLGDASQTLNDLGLKVGEKVELGKRVVLSADHIGDYVHSNGKIGVLVALDGGSDELAKDIAMHIAAMAPKVVSPEDVSAELVEKEKEIWNDELVKSGKPQEMWDKILTGKENKFRGEHALLKQEFVKEPGQKVEQILKGATVKEFHRFAI